MYHSSSVVSCGDGTKPLLPRSVPENSKSTPTVNINPNVSVTRDNALTKFGV